jgi:hypothetical protein
MNNRVIFTSPDDLVPAVLEGGPSNFPVALRTQMIDRSDRTIKIPHYGGYEHFGRAEEGEDIAPAGRITFRWATRTEIAELATAAAAFPISCVISSVIPAGTTTTNALPRPDQSRRKGVTQCNHDPASRTSR